MRNYENVYCRETKCCQRNREYSGSYDPAERISGREWILCYLDIRTLMYPARTGRIYGEMAKWNLGVLPMIPSKFRIRLIEDEGIKKQFAVIEELVSKAEW